MARCPFVYSDGARCVFDDYRLRNGMMCEAHRTVAHDRKRDVKKKTTKRARTRKKAEGDG